MADEAKNKKEKTASKIKIATSVVIAIMVLVWLFLPEDGRTTTPPAVARDVMRKAAHTETPRYESTPFKVLIWAPGWPEDQLSEVFSRRLDQGMLHARATGGAYDWIDVYDADHMENGPIRVPKGKALGANNITHYRYAAGGEKSGEPIWLEGELY